MLTIALPKGRLAEKGAELFRAAGMRIPRDAFDTRKLVIELPDHAVRLLLVKPSDVPVYVFHGTADLGVAGKDTLLEAELPLYELFDLGFGRCRVCVAGFSERGIQKAGLLRVATKYPRIAQHFFEDRGVDAEIIKLNGSIELAPIVGLSDVIVDIVESGSTLRENGLTILEEVMPVSARLVANTVSLKARRTEIGPVLERINVLLEEKTC